MIEVSFLFFGFVCGLLFNYASLKIRQTKLDHKLFEEGVSRGIHLAKMAHTEFLRCHDRDAMCTNLYMRTEFAIPTKEEIE